MPTTMVSKTERSPVRERLVVEQRHVDAHAPQRIGHLVAAAHDVADAHWRHFQIDDLRGQRAGQYSRCVWM